ncbi:glycoside hydrolase family 97 catalytic domain-containing protein [Pelagicoccus sp. SDUM812003]|uniref:glycoside hydrolase family 97 protein n=1 Tax=Pelagicoccus sp. SDUM812003 TaxID=3041267 RepID=UPI00280FE1DC|nr:glycoside hydrolase family 97 catalytic domain-containing protein [Pelagicoccus sp. SDUM812003]MDQ8203470.1 glycoside hydrolase family 97 catalytic domain-containing protein [Pelagicoccus sp. SDUM812003]
MRRLPLYFLLAFSSLVMAQEETSPDGSIRVEIDLDDHGRPSYQIELNGVQVLEPSPLGLETSIGSFSLGLIAKGVERREVSESYSLPHGKVREVDYLANEMVARFENAEGAQMEVLVRVSDSDVAFAYRISGDESQTRVTVLEEATGFDFPDSARAYVTWQSPANEGWMGTKPSYEEGYLIDVPVDRESPRGLGFTFPALFRLGDNGWALVSETGTSSRYAGTRLSDPTSEGLYTIAFPEPDENGGIGETTVSAPLPLLTPWRTITLGSTLAPIVESTVSTDVVEPLYEASIDYQPGRSTWSWLIWQDPSMNLEDQRTFIDLAAEMGYEYILIDALWDANIGRERMESLVKEANSKGVDVLLWYNSNGNWNDAPQTPRNIMDNAPARRNEMEWLQSIGVKGLKVDFFGGDKQVTLKLYEDILTDANDYGLHLNFHGATLPRGWERMYPNFMTAEAATASENLVFSQGFLDSEAHRSTIFPFVRNPVAAFDYGPMVLNDRLSRDQDSGTIRKTTDAFQLATTVLFQSPVQHFGLTPNNLDEQPKHVIDFLRQVPVIWDETRYIAGAPGDFAVLARRHGDDWYVAATNGKDETRRLELSAPFLAGESFSYLHEGEDGETELSQLKIDEKGGFSIELQANDGAVLYQ